MRVEKFWYVLSCRSRGFLFAHHLMRILRCFRGNHLKNETADGARRQRPKHVSSRHNLAAHAKVPFFASCNRYSEARQESAMIVSVGFLSGFVTSGAPSVTNRFFTSCAWQYPFNTLDFGSSPIRAVPTSWMIFPPAKIPNALGPSIGVRVLYVPPIVSMIERN